MFALPRLKVCFCLMPVEQDHGAVVGEGRFALGGKMPEDQTVRLVLRRHTAGLGQEQAVTGKKILPGDSEFSGEVNRGTPKKQGRIGATWVAIKDASGGLTHRFLAPPSIGVMG